MKRNILSLAFIMIFSFVFSQQNERIIESEKAQESECYIHLYDGDNFSDDDLIVGEGEYPDLDNLPGSEGENWTDGADSFIVGEDTKVTIWQEVNFEGESQEYGPGEYPSVDEPNSMVVECIQNVEDIEYIEDTEDIDVMEDIDNVEDFDEVEDIPNLETE